MRAGVVVGARPGVEELAARAEELGLRSFWVNDTPMAHGDPIEFVVAALLGPKAAAWHALHDARRDAATVPLSPSRSYLVTALHVLDEGEDEDRRGTTATASDRHLRLYPGYLGRVEPRDRDLAVPALT